MPANMNGEHAIVQTACEMHPQILPTFIGKADAIILIQVAGDIRRASQIFEAAYRLHGNFKLMFSADMCCSNDAADLEDMVPPLCKQPALLLDLLQAQRKVRPNDL